MRNALLALVMMALPTLAAASPLTKALPDGVQRGAASYRFIGVPLYDARLFTRAGAAFVWNEDFALELTYKRNLTQFDLVEGTLREMARIGASLPARAKLEVCYRAVRKGDRYLAVTLGANRIAFWLNDARTCTLNHPQIKRGFMAVFLGDNSRSKSFTRKLRGE